jgi:hypothetical protein
MAYYYSKETGGFYHSSLHETLPKDAVQITDEDYSSLMAAQSEGKVIVADKKGKPKAEDRPELTVDQLAELRVSNRAAAYRDEADPLFFKAQRGEATIKEWEQKVTEIKARYP